ncbi:alpha/beta fold hydrolase [Streptomyces litchfieldiae]|uniref:Alpha/beta hydrolase n=1 Tax=Streptomyces litchfieldiae TaxID=3075543 RepID=A0ABU2MZS5_9ACTN|nr:alpha/beta hydrolase [Streptomyces sp. DSM 44938]MDT0346768.1 alpha/beta hydrolase [Streptomyces sp. DSM 44938]
MRKRIAALAVAAVLAGTLTTAAHAHAPTRERAERESRDSAPTIVLMHGAFEDATAWAGVTRRLQSAGYRVIAPAVPLRGISADVAYLDSVMRTVQGPVVLAGHSYGGVIISSLAARYPARVAALVYVAALIPQTGDTINELQVQFPGTTLGPDTTYTADYPGGTDMYVRPESYRSVLAGDRTASDAAVAAATQRPLNTAVFTEETTTQAPADIPKFAMIATRDRAVVPAAQQFQAERAGARIYPVCSAHDMPVSHPSAVASVIEEAAAGAG